MYWRAARRRFPGEIYSATLSNSGHIAGEGEGRTREGEDKGREKREGTVCCVCVYCVCSVYVVW